MPVLPNSSKRISQDGQFKAIGSNFLTPIAIAPNTKLATSEPPQISHPDEEAEWYARTFMPIFLVRFASRQLYNRRMNKSTVLAFLKKNKDEKGIEKWKKRDEGTLRSYGIGLTILRKYAKSIGRNAKLAKSLWNSNIHEMKIISILIDDPKTMTIDQAESQVEEIEGGYLAHVFSSCDAPLAKAPFVVELADSWIDSDDAVRRRCGYGLLYEISKSKKKSAPDETYYLAHIADIDKKRDGASIPSLMSMSGALMGIGMRSKKLNKAALKVARAIGPITHSELCDPFDVAKNLTSDYAKKKLGL